MVRFIILSLPRGIKTQVGIETNLKLLRIAIEQSLNYNLLFDILIVVELTFLSVFFYFMEYKSGEQQQRGGPE